MSESSPLRRGWTTGACATAAARAAFVGLATGEFPDPVEIVLPSAVRVGFTAVAHDLRAEEAEVGVVKDAGDDPDVTHGAIVRARVAFMPVGHGIRFAAGPGVGTVTKPGLPLPVGEPAINPGPRKMMEANLREAAEALARPVDCMVTISIDDGEELAKRTWNPKLGIVGGLSVLGTTGVVIPYSCSAWIASIHQGIDVARAAGLAHVAACTGSTSEAAVKRLYALDDSAIIDMGDFVGGTLKYLKRHPIQKVTIAGGFAKLSKLAAGHMDLHSKRSEVDPTFLADLVGDPALAALSTANEMLQAAGGSLADAVARRAAEVVRKEVGPQIEIDVVVFDRAGHLVGRA